MSFFKSKIWVCTSWTKLFVTIPTGLTKEICRFSTVHYWIIFITWIAKRRRIWVDLVKDVALFVNETKVTMNRSDSSFRYWCGHVTIGTYDGVSSSTFSDERLGTLSTEGVTTREPMRITINLTTIERKSRTLYVCTHWQSYEILSMIYYLHV